MIKNKLFENYIGFTDNCISYNRIDLAQQGLIWAYDVQITQTEYRIETLFHQFDAFNNVQEEFLEISTDSCFIFSIICNCVCERQYDRKDYLEQKFVDDYELLRIQRH